MIKNFRFSVDETAVGFIVTMTDSCGRVIARVPDEFRDLEAAFDAARSLSREYGIEYVMSF